MKLPVLVGGAGIGGLSCALALARAGQQVVVLERAQALSEVGAGLQLGPNATRRLRLWGALDRLDGRALAPQAVDLMDAYSSEVVVSMPLDRAEALWGAPYLLAHRADLIDALEGAARSNNSIQLVTSAEFEDWRDESGRVRVFTKDRRCFEGSAFIAADGVRSKIRAKVQPGDTPVYSGWMAFRGLVPTDRIDSFWREPRSRLQMGAGAHLVHYPLRNCSVVNVVAVVEQSLSMRIQPDRWSETAEPEMLQASLKEWPSKVEGLLEKGEWRAWGLFVRKPARQWVYGRIALLGDAAHAMAPFLSQGAAQAIEDADALGQAFASHPADAPTALRVYEQARRTRATMVQMRSARQGSLYHMRKPASSLRNLTLRALGSKGMLRMSDWIYRH